MPKPPRRSWFTFVTVVLLAAASAGGCTDGAPPTAVESKPSLTRQAALIVATVRVTPSRDTLTTGSTVQLAGSVIDARGRTNAVARIAWSSDDVKIATVTATGLVRAIAAGTVVIRATSGMYHGTAAITVAPIIPTVPSPVAPVVPPPAAGGTWTRCAGGGEICTGLVAVRDVRLVAPTGAAVQQSFYGQVLCDPAMFGGRNPAPGTPLAQLHCEMGPLKTTTLTNPMPGMAGLGAQVTVAVGDTGASGPVRVASAAVPTQNANDGDFRSQCRLAKYAFDDPIVYPGQPGASHLHVFFGNTAVSAASTAQSLGATGNSTCIGGTLNRTAYWAPALVDARTGAVQTPLLGTFYYKTGYGMDTRALHALPAGLRMIAGDKTNTGYQQYATWSCASGGGTSSIPAGCPAGDVLRLTVTFPQCWDGVHLDSPDHKSHMAYPTYRNPPDQSTCPADHPVPLPVITEFFDYPVPAAGATATWRLSSDMYAASLPGGLSAHADWMMAWDAPTMQTMVSRCLNAARDCQVGLLGDGTALQFP